MPKVTLHFIPEGSPTREEALMAHQARDKGEVYRFVSEQWAIENDAVDCDAVVTENKDIIKKYQFDE